MSRLASALSVLAVVAAASPAAAVTDVPITVPHELLGGRVAHAQSVAPAGTVVGSPGDVTGDPALLDAENGVEMDDPNFWGEVWPRGAGAIAPPPEVEFDCADSPDDTACGIWGNAAAELEVDVTGTVETSCSVCTTPGVRQTEKSATSALPESTVGASRPLTPALGSWMSSQTPVLRWAPQPGATLYNVQVYRGPRRVASVWTTTPRTRLPAGVIDQGRYYMWAVWEGHGPRRSPDFAAEPFGRSVFGVVLRPRIVLSHSARGVVGEVRPPIPGGRLAVHLPGAEAGHRRKVLRIGRDSRIHLRGVRLADAQGLDARLLDVGGDPPAGLRAPLRPKS